MKDWKHGLATALIALFGLAIFGEPEMLIPLRIIFGVLYLLSAYTLYKFHPLGFTLNLVSLIGYTITRFIVSLTLNDFVFFFIVLVLNSVLIYYIYTQKEEFQTNE